MPGNGGGSANSPRQEIHTALWSSYLRLQQARSFPPAEAPLPVGALLNVLNVRSAKIPRPLLGLALWNLLPDDPGDAAPSDLDPLLRRVVDLSLEQTIRIYSENRSPLLVLGRQYGIEDYTWRWQPQHHLSTANAKLEIAVQKTFEEMKDAVFPCRWSSRCPFFWGGLAGPDPAQVKGEGHWSWKGRVEGPLTLPGGVDEKAPIPAAVEIELSLNPLSAIVEFAVVKNDVVDVCQGYIRVEKELGRPGTTRITHEKQLRFKPGTFDDYRVRTLAYWLQAETVCLVWPSDESA